jgi:hypothetical protein
MTSNEQTPITKTTPTAPEHRAVKVPKPGRRELRRREHERTTARPPKPMAPPATPRIGVVRDRDALNHLANVADEERTRIEVEDQRNVKEGQRRTRELDGEIDPGRRLVLQEGIAALQTASAQLSEQGRKLAGWLRELRARSANLTRSLRTLPRDPARP